MNLKPIDYIIVGQGLAGSCLALQLLSRQKKILVIDEQNPNSATAVAAGLFNPITGRHMGKTWMADTLFPYLHNFYEWAERFTGTNFFFPMPLYRPFLSIEEQNEWMGRSGDKSYAQYIDTLYSKPIQNNQVKNEWGGLLLKQCGYLNTNKFLEAVRRKMEILHSLLDEPFKEDQLILEQDHVAYQQWQAAKIIFCTGDQTRFSKYFPWLPVRPLKGETLTIKTEAEVSMIYNRGVYVVPGIWKVGATYNPREQSPGITEEGRDELRRKLNELISFPYTIEDQDWGFRPTTPDRRPLLGAHPEFEHLVIFNGLGTKGVSLAPYFSEVLANWIEKGVPLNNEVAVNRYKSLYSNPA